MSLHLQRVQVRTGSNDTQGQLVFVDGGLVAVLVQDGLIETKRGTITICDRAGLLAVAGAAYGQPEAEYERLLKHSGPSS